jgi:hypothetical protein
MRVNGSATRTATFAVDREVCNNCPEVHPAPGDRRAGGGRRRAPQRPQAVAAADRSSSPPPTAAPTPRGGSPGFSVGDDGLTSPTTGQQRTALGSLLANPRIGLLFLDWETGDTLQLTGSAEFEFESRAVHVRSARDPARQRSAALGAARALAVQSVIRSGSPKRS